MQVLPICGAMLKCMLSIMTMMTTRSQYPVMTHQKKILRRVLLLFFLRTSKFVIDENSVHFKGNTLFTNRYSFLFIVLYYLEFASFMISERVAT